MVSASPRAHPKPRNWPAAEQWMLPWPDAGEGQPARSPEPRVRWGGPYREMEGPKPERGCQVGEDLGPTPHLHPQPPFLCPQVIATVGHRNPQPSIKHLLTNTLSPVCLFSLLQTAFLFPQHTRVWVPGPSSPPKPAEDTG